MKNLFNFTIKSEQVFYKGKNKSLKEIKEEVELLEAKYG